jgi:hypothetical protein
VCAVRAILAARSPVFFRQLYQEPPVRYFFIFKNLYKLIDVNNSVVQYTVL